MKNIFIEGANVNSFRLSLLKRIRGLVRKISKIKDLSDLVSQVTKQNPDRIIIVAHSNKIEFLNISESEEESVNVHPAILEKTISDEFVRKGEEKKLKIVEFYGCLLGAGINNEAFSALVDEDRADLAIIPEKSVNVERYKKMSSGVTYILHGGQGEIVMPSSSEINSSLSRKSLPEIVLNHIITAGETLKVLTRNPASGRVEVFVYSAPKPKSLEDLSSGNIRKFLSEQIAAFAEFYTRNYVLDGVLSKKDKDIFDKGLEDAKYLDLDKLDLLKEEYCLVEVLRGKLDYAKLYLQDKAFIKESFVNRLLVRSISYDSEALQYIANSFKVKEFPRVVYSKVLEEVRPSCLQFLFQRSDYRPSFSSILNSRNFNKYNKKYSLAIAAIAVVYGCKIPDLDKLEKIKEKVPFLVPVFQIALSIKNREIVALDSLVNNLTKIQNENLGILLKIIDRDMVGKYLFSDLIDEHSNSRLSPESVKSSYSKLHPELFFDEELKLRHADIKEVAMDDGKKGFLYVPEEYEKKDSIWQSTSHRIGFRLLGDKSNYSEVVERIVQIIYKAAADARINEKEALKAIKYERANGGMSAIYDKRSKSYVENTEIIPDELRLFSNIFKDLSRANGIINPKTSEGLSLALLPSSVVEKIIKQLKDFDIVAPSSSQESRAAAAPARSPAINSSAASSVTTSKIDRGIGVGF